MLHGVPDSARKWAQLVRFGAVFNRQSVQEALRSAQQILKRCPNKPENGLALYCGGGIHELVEPPSPIVRPYYHCGKGFETGPLQKMIEVTDRPGYGVVVIDGSEAVLGVFTDQDSPVKMLKRLSVQNQCRTRRGGMSALRLDRIRDEVEHGFVVRTAEACNEVFLNVENGGGGGGGGGVENAPISGLILAGPSNVKHLLSQSGALSKSLKTKIVGAPFETSRGGRHALREAVVAATDALREVAAAPETAAISSIMDLVHRGEDGIEVVYGIRATLAALAVGACESVVASAPLAEQAAVKTRLSELGKTFGTTIIWVGSVHNATYSSFEGIEGFAARLRWPFEDIDDDIIHETALELNEATEKPTHSNTNTASSENTGSEKDCRLGTECPTNSQPVQPPNQEGWMPNPLAAEWVPSESQLKI